MADNYIEFSEVIPNLTDAEIAWLQNQLQTVVVTADGQERPADSEAIPSNAIPSDAVAGEESWRGPRFLRGCDEDTCWTDEPDFAHEFQLAEPEGDWGRHLWIYSDEHGNIDQVALLVQKFLREFRPREIWTLTYAATCSKPRVGEFGGGAVIVTADGVRWEDAQSIAENACRAHNAESPTGAATSTAAG